MPERGAFLLGRFRYSLLTAAIALTLFAFAFAYFERRTWTDGGSMAYRTREVPAGEEEATRRLIGWLQQHGFRRVESLPESQAVLDVFDAEHRNFFVGSFQGSRPIYFNFHPNYMGAERGPRAAWSNLFVYMRSTARIRTWETESEFRKLRGFLDEFNRWCDDFEPALETSTAESE